MAELTLFVSELDQPDSHILKRYKVRSYKDFESRRDDFDLAIYNIGNSDFHDDISQLAIEFPGVVVLHDVFLHHAVALRTIGKNKHFAYAREMGYGELDYLSWSGSYNGTLTVSGAGNLVVGYNYLDMFFDYWFPKKCMWATPASLRGMAASLKKFYAFMRDAEMITADQLDEVKQTIKADLPGWLETLEDYLDPDLDRRLAGFGDRAKRPGADGGEDCGSVRCRLGCTDDPDRQADHVGDDPQPLMWPREQLAHRERRGRGQDVV